MGVGVAVGVFVAVSVVAGVAVAVAVPVVAVTVPVIPALSNEKAPLCRGLFHFSGKQPLLFVFVKGHEIAVPAAAYAVHMVARV